MAFTPDFSDLNNDVVSSNLYVCVKFIGIYLIYFQFLCYWYITTSYCNNLVKLFMPKQYKCLVLVEQILTVIVVLCNLGNYIYV